MVPQKYVAVGLERRVRFQVQLRFLRMQPDDVQFLSRKATQAVVREGHHRELAYVVVVGGLGCKADEAFPFPEDIFDTILPRNTHEVLRIDINHP